MRKSIRPILWRLAMAFVFACSITGIAYGAADKAKKVLLIGIDGCRFDALMTAKSPRLHRLVAEGCYNDECQILGDRYIGNDTVSGPGWSSILTGVWADKHGVDDNQFKGKQFDKFPHFFARLKEAQSAANTVSIVSWEPIQDHIVSHADVARLLPKWGANDTDVKAAKEAAKILTESDPTVLFLYIGQVDAQGHKNGFHPTVEPYIKAIENADACVGIVLDAIAERTTIDREDWLTIVTSDHGGTGKDHSRGHDVPEIRNSFVILSGQSAQRGKLDQQSFLVDVPVTALAHLGVVADPKWELDGRPVGLKSDLDARAK